MSQKINGYTKEEAAELVQYIKEGKSQFVIAVGCTGGMHRSVYIAKHIFDRLTAQGYSTRLEHRDLMKNDVREHVREEC